MREHPNKRTLDELEQMIKDIQYFLDHPRTQQNRWVAKGTTWIPLLKHIREELRSEVEYYYYNETLSRRGCGGLRPPRLFPFGCGAAQPRRTRTVVSERRSRTEPPSPGDVSL